MQCIHNWITLDSTKLTKFTFKRCLEFLYTGCIDLKKDSEGLEDTLKQLIFSIYLDFSWLWRVCMYRREMKSSIPVLECGWMIGTATLPSNCSRTRYYNAILMKLMWFYYHSILFSFSHSSCHLQCGGYMLVPGHKVVQNLCSESKQLSKLVNL